MNLIRRSKQQGNYDTAGGPTPTPFPRSPCPPCPKHQQSKQRIFRQMSSGPHQGIQLVLVQIGLSER